MVATEARCGKHRVPGPIDRTKKGPRVRGPFPVLHGDAKRLSAGVNRVALGRVNVETIERHYLGPRIDEVVDELFFATVLRVNLGDGAQLGM